MHQVKELRKYFYTRGNEAVVPELRLSARHSIDARHIAFFEWFLHFVNSKKMHTKVDVYNKVWFQIAPQEFLDQRGALCGCSTLDQAKKFLEKIADIYWINPIDTKLYRVCRREYLKNENKTYYLPDWTILSFLFGSPYEEGVILPKEETAAQYGIDRQEILNKVKSIKKDGLLHPDRFKILDTFTPDITERRADSAQGCAENEGGCADSARGVPIPHGVPRFPHAIDQSIDQSKDLYNNNNTEHIKNISKEIEDNKDLSISNIIPQNKINTYSMEQQQLYNAMYLISGMYYKQAHNSCYTTPLDHYLKDAVVLVDKLGVKNITSDANIIQTFTQLNSTALTWKNDKVPALTLTITSIINMLDQLFAAINSTPKSKATQPKPIPAETQAEEVPSSDKGEPVWITPIRLEANGKSNPQAYYNFRYRCECGWEMDEPRGVCKNCSAIFLWKDYK